MRLLLFGAPGTGKSTYSSYLSEKLNLPWVSTGNLFRELAEKDSRIKEILSRGQLLPDEEVNRIVFNKLSETGGKFILDGFPRTVVQAQSFKDFLDSRGWKIDRAFKLVVPVDVVVDRMAARGREDDDPKVIKERFEIYERQTAPVLDFFRNLGIAITDVDNAPPIEEVKKEFDIAFT